MNTASTIAWNLMPDHFHFMIHTDNRSVVTIQQGGLVIDALSNSVRKLLSGYAQYFNKKYKRTGSLFRQKTKCKCLTMADISCPYFITMEESLKNCFNYIHTNPVLAGLVANPEDWEFSSYTEYTGERSKSICDKELANKYGCYDPETFSQTL